MVTWFRALGIHTSVPAPFPTHCIPRWLPRGRSVWHHEWMWGIIPSYSGNEHASGGSSLTSNPALRSPEMTLQKGPNQLYCSSPTNKSNSRDSVKHFHYPTHNILKHWIIVAHFGCLAQSKTIDCLVNELKETKTKGNSFSWKHFTSLRIKPWT